ncbi:MAG: DUF4388 domain-containing protein [Planctomycetota bacterium]|jgi:hypothetical protein
MMPKIARKTLGLRDGTFSRIQMQANAIVFNGEGVTQRRVLLPVSMLGTYHGNILNNLFMYVANNRHNGFLGVTTGPLTKGVFFKKGHIVFSGSTDATERIGNVAMRMGLVTAEQIRSVEQNPDPRRFGVRLRAAGLLTYEQLWEALRHQVMEICASLVDFPVGNYFFMPNCVPADTFNHFMIEPEEALFHGAIAADERDRARGDVMDQRSPLEVLASMEMGEGL